jgi:hypothetical protein
MGWENFGANDKCGEGDAWKQIWNDTAVPASEPMPCAEEDGKPPPAVVGCVKNKWGTFQNWTPAEHAIGKKVPYVTPWRRPWKPQPPLRKPFLPFSEVDNGVSFDALNDFFSRG